MSSTKIPVNIIFYVPTIPPAGGWGFNIGGAAFGVHRLHTRTLRWAGTVGNPNGATHDIDQPRWIELRTTVVPSKFKIPKKFSHGYQPNPWNIVIERVTGTWQLNRGTTLMSGMTAWVRPAAMRTRGMINRTRLTRLESVSYKRTWNF